MQFVFPTLAFGFFLVLLPVLIHLINMMRHRRVKWGPMEFLLASYKKHRRWVWLKQLLLLLARMAAVAAVVAMLAQLTTYDQWAQMFGGKVTHHFVLLDDSYSMSDRAAGETAFDRAKAIVGQIGERASGKDSRQKFTLVRFSRAALSADGDDKQQIPDAFADITAETIDGGAFKDRLDARRRAIDVTQLAVGANPALSVAKQLVEESPDENRIVYVVSDFRAGQWRNPVEARQTLQEIEKAGAEVHLINCVKVQRPNLGITELFPSEATRAAGVPLFVNIKIKNFGATPARDVQFKIRPLFYDPVESKNVMDDPSQLVPSDKSSAVATEPIEEIAPGESVTRRVQVFFPTAGQHVIEATLPDDPVAADNSRYTVVDLEPAERVLMVDDGAPRGDYYYLDSILRPSAKVNTGIAPERRSPAELRSMSVDDLRKYRAVYLLNVDRLDDSSIAALEEYVKLGGGVAYFLGPAVNIAHYNEKMYRDDQGLFPVELDRVDMLDPQTGDERVPDFEVADHPVLSIFRGENSPFLRSVTIDKYYRAREGWSPGPESTAKVLAELRATHKPLIVERQFGEGRVVAFLTTASPLWNTWSKGPALGIMALSLQPYLAAPQWVDRPRTVGTPIELTLDPRQYSPELQFIVPGVNATSRKRIVKQAIAPGGAVPGGQPATAEGAADPQPDEPAPATASADATAPEPMRVAIGKPSGDVLLPGETEYSGVYESWAINSEGELDLRRYALNVESPEGDLAILEPQQLLEELKPAKVRLHQADEIYDLTDQAGYNWSEIILYGLICLLLAEQLLAYTASYHRAPGGAR